VAQGVGREFKAQYHKKKKTKNNSIHAQNNFKNFRTPGRTRQGGRTEGV
jgi:hypothetical protein